MPHRIARVESPEGTDPSKAGHFDAAGFYAALDAERRAQGINWKQVAAAAGVSASTLTRMAQGKRPDVDSLAALASWSGLNVDKFVVATTSKTIKKVSSIAAITAHLRSDPHLSADSAAAIEDIIKAAYDRLRKE